MSRPFVPYIEVSACFDGTAPYTFKKKIPAAKAEPAIARARRLAETASKRGYYVRAEIFWTQDEKPGSLFSREIFSIIPKRTLPWKGAE